MNELQLEKLDVMGMVDAYLIPWGLNIVFAMLIFIIGKFVVGVIVSLVKKVMSKARVDGILVNFISSIIKSVLLLFVVIAALDQLGVDTTSLIALIGAAGLAIGLALQGSLQNLASGVMLIIFRPFTAGDFIEGGGATGTVNDIGIFTTKLISPDNKEIIVPNGEMFSGIIINYSKQSTRRIDMVFGIGYDDDIRKAKALLEKIVGEHESVLKSPAPQIVVGELADSSVNFNVRPWVNTEDYWSVYFDLNEKIKMSFDESGISIPYPQMDVHLDKAT